MILNKSFNESNIGCQLLKHVQGDEIFNFMVPLKKCFQLLCLQRKAYIDSLVVECLTLKSKLNKKFRLSCKILMIFYQTNFW